MRFRTSLQLVFTLAVLCAPVSVLAQFQAPTPEELKMTDDPKAPGAIAVYLNIAEVTNDPQHFKSFYTRIKVLQEKGKELATVELPYWDGAFTINGFNGRTIHSDGTIIPLVVKPEDLLIAKNEGSRLKQKVVTLPDVEVGSILEYYYQLRYDQQIYSSPQWEIQRPYFVHKSHYVFTPMDTFMNGTQNVSSIGLVNQRGEMLSTLVWYPQLPPGKDLKAQAVGRFVLDLDDIPPIPHEDWMPPVNSAIYEVLFYYAVGNSAADYWNTEAKRWSKEVDHFAEVTGPIHDAVSNLVAASDSDVDKAKKLYSAVQQLDNTDFTRRKGQAELRRLHMHASKRAEDIWAQKSGDSEEISLLYLAMLHAAGITAYEMKVVDRNRALIALGHMDFDQLQDDVVIANLGGKDVLLDPGEKMCPFQMVSWKDTGAGGVRQTSTGGGPATSPLLPYNVNTMIRIGDLTLDAQGQIVGSFRFVMTGQQALHWRQMAIESDEDEVNKEFNQWLGSIVPGGIEAHLDRFQALDNPDANLVAMVSVRGQLANVTSKRLLLPGLFFETRGAHPFVDEPNRQQPVDMHYAEQVTDQVVFHLPDGFTIEGAPQDTKIPWATNAVFVIKSKAEPGKITISRSLARGFTILGPDEYPGLRDFYQKVAAADQQPLVLTSSPGEKAGAQ